MIRLQRLFQEALAAGTMNPEILRDLLQLDEGEGCEPYAFTWHGKRHARALADTPPAGILREHQANGEKKIPTENRFIEGDNLEVLKLLQPEYAGRVRLIYIDPPYNTGKDFVYADDFRDNLRDYLRQTGRASERSAKPSANDTSGRLHTAWLNMMLPRLILARRLLRPDGAIFISCDETEQARLRMMMDELFGEENFVADMVWAAGRKNDSRLISVSHEYIVCYCRDAAYLRKEKVEWRARKKGLTEIYAQHRRLLRQHRNDFAAMTAGLKQWFRELPDGHPSKAHRHFSCVDQRGIYFPDNISWPGGGGPRFEVLHPVTRRPVKIPSRGWMTSDPARFQQWIDDDRVHFGRDETTVPCIKSYLHERETTVPYSVFYQDGRAATRRLRHLMGGDYFHFPKDETVLQEIVGMASTGEDIVLDFFAGSGTLGHAVMAQNAADGGHRRYLLVQSAEPLDPEHKDQRAAAELCDALNRPRTIAELTKERLRRVADHMRHSHPGQTSDFQFRTFVLEEK